MMRKVRFVDPGLLYQTIKGEIDQAYTDVMTHGDLIDRGQLKNFEDNLATFVGTKFAVGLNSGYDALHMSLRAAGIGPGDEVIVPAHTFVATCSAVVNVGATPVLVDVTDDFNIDVTKIAPAITSRTRGIIPVHLSGWMADMRAVMAIAKTHNLVVVEDACQSLGSSLDGKRAGSWGRTGCWSSRYSAATAMAGPSRPTTRKWRSSRGGCAITARTATAASTTATASPACSTICRRRFWM